MNPEELFKNIQAIFEQLNRIEKRPPPATKEEVERIKDSKINLNSVAVASHLKEAILKTIPADKLEQVSQRLEKNSQTSQASLVYLCGLLVCIVLALGMLVGYYHSYKAAAYKYTYLQQDFQLGFNRKASLSSAIAFMDSLQGSNFSIIEKKVDSTDVSEMLEKRALEAYNKEAKLKGLPIENNELNVPPMYKIIFLLVGVLLVVIGYRMNRF